MTSQLGCCLAARVGGQGFFGIPSGFRWPFMGGWRIPCDDFEMLSTLVDEWERIDSGDFLFLCFTEWDLFGDSGDHFGILLETFS